MKENSSTTDRKYDCYLVISPWTILRNSLADLMDILLLGCQDDENLSFRLLCMHSHCSFHSFLQIICAWGFCVIYANWKSTTLASLKWSLNFWDANLPLMTTSLRSALWLSTCILTAFSTSLYELNDRCDFIDYAGIRMTASHSQLAEDFMKNDSSVLSVENNPKWLKQCLGTIHTFPTHPVDIPAIYKCVWGKLLYAEICLDVSGSIFNAWLASAT